MQTDVIATCIGSAFKDDAFIWNAEEWVVHTNHGIDGKYIGSNEQASTGAVLFELL